MPNSNRRINEQDPSARHRDSAPAEDTASAREQEGTLSEGASRSSSNNDDVAHNQEEEEVEEESPDPNQHYYQHEDVSTSDEYAEGQDEMYLFESPRQQTPLLGPDHALSKSLPGITEFALNEFLDHISPTPTTIPPSPRPPKRTRLADEPSARKRLKQAGFEAAMTLPQHPLPDDPTAVLVDIPCPKSKSYACPFYLADPLGNMHCLTRTPVLSSIRDLKQHLWTAHRQPPYCPVCKLAFGTAAACDEHIRARTCSADDGRPVPQGISTEQMQRLARRADPWIADEVQWLAIWGIVFPREAASAPRVSWHVGEMEGVVCVVREYWNNKGDEVVREYLRRHSLPDGEEDVLASVRHSVLDGVVDQIVESYRREDASGVDGEDEKREWRGAATRVLASWRRLWQSSSSSHE